jgi:hypothetical protein
MSEDLFLTTPNGRVKAATIVGTTLVRHGTDFCRKYNGYGLALINLLRARSAGCLDVRVGIWSTPLSNFFRKDTPEDALGGFEVQRFVPISDWQ